MAGFRAQPFDVGTAYTRFGQSLQTAFEAPQKALTMIEDLKTRKLDRKIKEYTLEQAAKEVDRKELKKEFMDSTMMEFIDQYEGTFDEPGVSETVAGPPTPQVQKLSAKMSQKQFLDTVGVMGKAIEAGDSDKFKRIMGNVRTLLQQEMPQSKDYGGGISLNQWNAQNLDKEGFLDNVQQMNDGQVTNFFDQSLPTVFKAYEAQLPEGEQPTEEGAVKFMTSRPEYEKIPNSQMQRTDGWRKQIKDRYQTKKEVAQTQESEAQATRTEMTNQEKANDWLFKKKEKAEGVAEKTKSLSRRAEAMAEAVGAQRVLDSEPANTLQAQTAFTTLLDKEKDELQAEASGKVILEKTGGSFTEDMYDTVIQENGGNMPGIKNYGDFLTTIGENRPPEDESFLEKGVRKVTEFGKELLGKKEETPVPTKPNQDMRVDPQTGRKFIVEIDPRTGKALRYIREL